MNNYGALKPLLALNIAGSTPILTASWTEVVAALAKSAAAFQIINTTDRILRIGVGAAAQEEEIPFYVNAGEVSPIILHDFSRGSRISARALGSDTTTGDLVVNFLG